MVAYHDDEWGVPTHQDTGLFELLTLEGAQAGLSWATILRKRSGYRRAFAGFEPGAVAAFTDDDIERLLQDAAIVRHRGKIESGARQIPMEVDPAHATAYIVNPLTGRQANFANLFRTHPPTEERVARLRSMAQSH